MSCMFIYCGIIVMFYILSKVWCKFYYLVGVNIIVCIEGFIVI